MGNDMVASGYERTVNIDTAQFSVETEIRVKEDVDNPELLADKLQDHLDDCLIEFVVSQGTE